MAENEELEAVAASPVGAGARQRGEGTRSVSDHFAVVAIALGWAALAAIVNPIGEVILNDDGAYAYAVKSILETGSLKLSLWSSANLVSQAYWGALFCLPFGFSYTALRFSTLTIALAALLALYGLMREAGAGGTTALFGVLILAVNPLFFELSFTFMTDVPFLGFTLVAAYFLVRGVRRQSRVELALGLSAATVALLTRQTGLALFFALSLTYLVKDGLCKRGAMKAVAPALLGLGVQFSYQTLLRMTGRMPATFGNTATAALDIRSLSISYATVHVASGLLYALAYVGLFVLPLLLFLGYGRLRDVWRRQKWIAILTSATLLAPAAAQLLHHHELPLLPNVLYDIGLGPVMVQFGQHTLPAAGPIFWRLVKFMSFIAAALVLQVLIRAVLLLVRARGKHQELLLILLATGVIYFLPLPFIPTVYDRYYLPLVPLAIVILFMICSEGRAIPRRWTALAVLCLMTYGAFSIAGTHDYLAWNRPRWQALRTLTVARHISPERIDGGFEFYSFYKLPRDKTPYGDDFLISLSPVAGYVETDRYSFRRWLPPGDGTILVLRKNSIAPAVRTSGNAALDAPPMP